MSQPNPVIRPKSARSFVRLIWGDKKYALSSLLAEFAVKVNLIYIDPLGFAFEAPIQLALRGHS